MKIRGWNEAHAQQVRDKLVEEEARDPVPPMRLEWLAALKHRLMVCLSMIDDAIGVDEQGRLWLFSEDANEKPNELSETDSWAWTALESMTKQPEFADLRPARPTSARTCAECSGAGQIAIGAAVFGCGTCLGFGWTLGPDMVAALTDLCV